MRAIQKVFELKQAGDLSEAAALLSWLAGSTNVAASAKKVADIRGDIGSRDAMAYLRGIVGMVHAAGYKGLVIVIDEAETILRMRRGKVATDFEGEPEAPCANFTSEIFVALNKRFSATKPEWTQNTRYRWV